MKKLFVILFLVSGSIFGQTHNDDILKFVNENLGKKIGKGVCFELVQAAVRTYAPDFVFAENDQKAEYFGKPIKEKDVQPGDIVRFSGGTKRKASHVAIVYKINNGRIYLAEQNTNGSLGKSVVEINPLDYEWHEEYYGAKVVYKFYRPQ